MADTFMGTGGGFASFAGRASRGTNLVPSALGSGDEITHLSAWGYGTSAYSSAPRGLLSIFAAEAWTNSAQGTRIGFHTTAPGGTTTSEKVRIWGDGGVQIGGTYTASLGAGALFVNGATSMQGIGLARATAAVSTVLDATTCYFTFTGSTASQTITLPAANLYGSSRTQMLVIRNKASVTVTVARAGSDTIDGATSIILAPGACVFLFSDGSTAWDTN
jgi:hypothetical protein